MQTEKLCISFKRLDNLIKLRGESWQKLRDAGISPAIVQKVQRGTGHTDTRTIQKICEIFRVQPGEIMEYIPDGVTPEAPRKRAKPGTKTE